MNRDWTVERAALQAQATEAFQVVLRIRKAVEGAKTSTGENDARYLAESA